MMSNNRIIKLGKIRTSKIELIDIAKAWIVISLAFAFARTGFAIDSSFVLIFIVSVLTVGVGFLLHELAHKFSAQYYGCEAEFRAFDQMLILALVLALFTGFIFAAPGAVMIAGQVTRKENGVISAVGPITNYVLALLFFGMNFVLPALSFVWIMGFQINMWLGLFNMIPFGNFDGIKIWRWSPVIWTAMTAFGVFFTFFFLGLV